MDIHSQTLQQIFLTDLIWNGQNLAAESKGNITNAYTYDMTGVHIANQNGTVTSYLKDYHGNVIGKITKSGERVTTTDYDAFGNRWMGDTPDPFGYCGEYLDSESGLIYLRNRYYDTTSGRFITEDPVKDGLNWYSYCSGNPVIFTDPLGLVDVIASYIVRKNGGSISWDDKTKSATVEMPNCEPIAINTQGDGGGNSINGRIANNRLIVDSQDLIDKFGLGESQAIHNEGDAFDSADDAVMAFGLIYLPKSRSEGREYGALINHNQYGYYFTKISKADIDYATFLQITQGMNYIQRYLYENNPSNPSPNRVNLEKTDFNTSYIVHTHWKQGGNLNFTNPGDYEAAKQYKNITGIYLVNRLGDIYKSEILDNGEYPEGAKLFGLY